jgi:hypothetical protein
MPFLPRFSQGRGPTELLEAERAAQEEAVLNDASLSYIQDQINSNDAKRRQLMEYAERYKKVAPGSKEHSRYLTEAAHLDKQNAVLRGALGNARPQTAIPQEGPAAAPPPAISEAAGTTAPAPMPQGMASAPPEQGPPQPPPPPRSDLRWKFGGSEGEWNNYYPESGTSMSDSGGAVERPTTLDYLSAGVGGGRPDPSTTNKVIADVSRGGGGFYAPSEDDVAYLPPSVLEEAARRTELDALRKQREAISSMPATIQLPEDIDPNKTSIPTQDYIERVLPAILQMQGLERRYPTLNQKVDTLVQTLNQFDEQLAALTSQATELASRAESEEERLEIASKYRPEIERIKEQKAAVANLLSTHKNILSGGF